MNSRARTFKYTVSVFALVALGCSKSDKRTTERPRLPPTEAEQPAATAGQPGTQPKPAANGQAMINNVRQCWQAYDAKNRDRLARCFAPDATTEVVDSVPPEKGPSMQVVGRHLSAFPDAKANQVMMLADDSRVVTVTLMKGTHKGELMGIQPTGKQMGMYTAHVFDMRSPDKISTERVYLDQNTMLGQLGLHAAPHRPAETSAPNTTVTAVQRDTPTEQSNLAKAKSYNDMLNKHDVNAMDAMIAPGATIRDVTMPADLMGAEGHHALMASYFKAFPDMRCDTRWNLAAGAHVVNAWRCTGTNTGSAPAIGMATPTGKSATLEGLTVLRMDNERIGEMWLFYNGRGMAKQLGLLPTGSAGGTSPTPTTPTTPGTSPTPDTSPTPGTMPEQQTPPEQQAPPTPGTPPVEPIPPAPTTPPVEPTPPAPESPPTQPIPPAPTSPTPETPPGPGTTPQTP